MSNLDVIKKIQKIYDPKTAFGNVELIEILKEIEMPDEEGFYKSEGEVEEITQYNLLWVCANCGYHNSEDDTDKNEGELYDDMCDNCKIWSHIQL